MNAVTRKRAGPLGVRFPEEQEGFVTRKLSDLLWGHPVLYSMYTGFLHGVKRPKRQIGHSPHFNSEVKKSETLSLLLLYAFMMWTGAI